MILKLVSLISISFLIFTSSLFPQKSIRDSLQLKTEQLNFYVWRTDFYICTAIAYAKNLGKTPKDLALFVGNEHAYTWDGIKGKGITPIIQLFKFAWNAYKNGYLEVLTKSDTSAVIKGNRPYLEFFENGKLLGVTIAEYEHFFWNHVQVMMNKIGYDSRVQIDDQWIYWFISKKN